MQEGDRKDQTRAWQRELLALEHTHVCQSSRPDLVKLSEASHEPTEGPEGTAMEDSVFDKGNEIYTDVKQWSLDVKILW